jgi:hypothetical protein
MPIPAGSFLSTIDPGMQQQLQQAGQYGTVTGANGTTYSNVGVEHIDEGGSSYIQNGYLGYAPGTDIHEANALRAEYGTDGGFAQIGQNQQDATFGNFAITTAALIAAVFTAGSSLSALAASGAAEGAGAGAVAAEGGSAAETGDVMANLSGRIPDALDSLPAGGSESSSFLTGGDYTSGANYDLTSGGGLKVPGENGTYLSSSSSGEGLTFNDTPNVESMGGGQGLTVQGDQVIGDAGSFINNPDYALPGAEQTTISETGSYGPTGTNPDYTPDLGDPNSFINGGTEGIVDDPVAAGGEGGGAEGGGEAGTTTAGTTTTLKDILAGLQAGGTIASLLGALTTKTPTAQAPLTPPQPAVGADGAYANASAVGGAGGSLAGVAGTLLTARDTFGFGRSMLG